MATILDGKKCAEEILQKLKQQIQQHNLKIKLSIILVGNDPASQIYTSMKQKRAAEVGIEAQVHFFPDQITQEELCILIKELNVNTDGIMIQLPLPKHLDKRTILNTIDPKKDIDGLTSESLAKIFNKDESTAPATPKGIINLLEKYNLSVHGKNCTIINHSELIGKPLAIMLLNRGATITICHEFTADLKEHTKKADFVITAVGKPDLITKDHIKENAIIIDAGTAKKEGNMVGDVKPDVKEKALYLTPVPGGVGPMTIATLLSTAVELKIKESL